MIHVHSKYFCIFEQKCAIRNIYFLTVFFVLIHTLLYDGVSSIQESMYNHCYLYIVVSLLVAIFVQSLLLVYVCVLTCLYLCTIIVTCIFVCPYLSPSLYILMWTPFWLLINQLYVALHGMIYLTTVSSGTRYFKYSVNN